MLKRLKSWPKWARIWFCGVLAAFWISKAVFSYQHGPLPYLHTDGQSEMVAIYGAQHFVTEGFFKNYLLPTYPPFGHAPGGEPRKEPFVYTHYLAGPELTMGLVLKVFGVNAIPTARLVPHTFTVVAVAWLALEFATMAGSAALGCVFLSLMLVPRSLSAWSICLHGHAYAMAIYLCLVAGMLRILNQTRAGKRVRARVPIALGFLVGFGQMFYELDWIPLSFIAGMSIVCMFKDYPIKHGMRVLVAMIAGGVAAAVYQVGVTSLYFGSVSYTINNFIEWFHFRRGEAIVKGFSVGEGQTLDDLRLHKVLHEYNRQAYGATGFTGLNLFFMSVGFIVMGFLGKVQNAAATKRLAGALVLGYLAAIAWNVGMRQHSLAHIHFLPRHYYELYMTFLLIALPIAHKLVVRSRKAT